MSCIYENNSDAVLVFDHLVRTITISKQLSDDYQQPFLDHINCMIEKNHAYLETENIPKVLYMIASINSATSKLMMITSVDHLTKTLRKKQLSGSSSRNFNF